MSSIRRINANRINGSKSRGPVTAEGKRISAANAIHSTGPVTAEGKARVSQNALKHGLLARSVALPSECREGFDEAFAALREEFQPRTYLETRLVEIMAVADWRRTRAWQMEMAQHTHAIRARQSAADPVADAENAEFPAMYTALAFGDLCDQSTVLRVLHRYETRLSREFIRHFYLYESRRRASPEPNFSKQTEPNASEPGSAKRTTDN